jgi:ADP-heptose:LPS heptosyltransferase
MIQWKTHCRHFRGEKPCRFNRACDGCPHESPMGRRILIFKIGALGDVLRTTPILRALEDTPAPRHVTWLVGEGARPLLDGHPRIDRLLTPGYETSALLEVEKFDLLLSLDKDAYSTSLAMKIDAPEHRGFGRDHFGALIPLHSDSRYAYDLGLSDELKFHQNQMTYQQIIFEMCGLPWKGEEYDLPGFDRDAQDESWKRTTLEAAGVRAKGLVVGFNTGAGGVFANKAWTVQGYADLAKRLAAQGCTVALLGGSSEAAKNQKIALVARGAAVDTGGHRSLTEFAHLVGACDLVVTGDTLGMHLAIAAQVPVIVLFGSTCPQEIELYGRGEKIVTPISCHPCYLKTCDISPSCQDLISVETVHEACARALSTMSSRARM